MDEEKIEDVISDEESTLDKSCEVKESVKLDKKSHNKTIIFLIIMIVVLFIASFSICFWALVSGKIKIVYDDKKVEKENINIKQTELVSVKSDGVYITDVSAVVDEVMPSIVSITSKTIINSGRYGPYYQYVAEGAGSGVIVKENDDEIFILTNYHVVKDSTELSIKFINDDSYDATLKGVSERKDIAIVSIKKSDIKSETLESIKVARLGSSDDLMVGNGIIAIGNALGYGQSVTTGVVSALNREVETEDYSNYMIQIDAAINGGNSGGALLNSHGEVVGINTIKYSSNGQSSNASIEGMGFAIPMSDIKELIESLISGNNDVSNVTLGIEGYMTTSGTLSYYNLPDGFYVTSIVESSNADNSELEIGNIIEEIDGKKVTSIDVIKRVLKQKNKGDSITLKISYVDKKAYKEKEIIVSLN